jgi:hypothetical protein
MRASHSRCAQIVDDEGRLPSSVVGGSPEKNPWEKNGTMTLSAHKNKPKVPGNSCKCVQYYLRPMNAAHVMQA